MQHPDEGTIHAWLDGALSADEAASLEAHVNECAQCQAAVAEARGFIAGSSRILTALDNAPRGVIPAAKPRRQIDPWVWRIAATVLFVAAGTLVVVRKTGVNRIESTVAPMTAVSRDNGVLETEKAATASTPTASAERAAATPSAQKPGPTPNRRVLSNAPSTITLNPTITGNATRSGGSRADRKQGQRVTTIPEGDASVAQGSAVMGAAAPAAVPAPPAAVGGTPKPFSVLGAPVAGVADMSVTAENHDVRLVGTRRAIGFTRITLYEVQPGDTVEFGELSETQLNAVVVTGATTTRAAAGQMKPSAVAKASAPADTVQPTPTGEAGADSSRTLSAQAPMVQNRMATRMPNGMNTITWTDSAGKVLRLSGRHSPAELEQIRRRIERARAAAADSARKNR